MLRSLSCLTTRLVARPLSVFEQRKSRMSTSPRLYLKNGNFCRCSSDDNGLIFLQQSRNVLQSGYGRIRVREAIARQIRLDGRVQERRGRLLAP